ncbi:mediator of RNA polymerase II transcription subunit 8 [Orbilia blumenaviensis]|uniref:Mediator of RNA polymerase II transcription subunit 8 n=1 Tax=Orbilia blumenaviensis TaxID=1796055 RepID=A0AAV9VHB6_9PEZI
MLSLRNQPPGFYLGLCNRLIGVQKQHAVNTLTSIAISITTPPLLNQQPQSPSAIATPKKITSAKQRLDMATSTLPVDALDRMRIQLGLLTQSINSLLQELRLSDPLPSWTTLTAQLAILNSQVSTISRSLHQHSAALSTTVVFPLPTFPGRTQDGQLHRLLGKKLSPEVQDWIQSGRKAGLALTAKPKNSNDDSDDDSEPEAEDEPEQEDDDDEMDEDEDDADDPEHRRRNRHWALKIVQKDQRSRDWESDFTKEEIETVNGDLTRIQTGLRTHSDGTIIKRALDLVALSNAALVKRDDKAYTLDMIFRFISTGVRPVEDHPGI